MHFFTTLPLYYYLQYIVFSLQKYLFWLFFNVENKVVLMWSEKTLRCSYGTLKTVQSAFPVLSLVCAFPAGPMTRPEPVRGGRGRERGAELVRVNNRVLMVSLACTEKPPPRRLKKQTSTMRTNLLKQNISLTYKLIQINIAIMFIFIKINNIIGIKK